MKELILKVINFDPADRNPESGVVAYVTWHNPDVRQALNKLFGIKKHEWISAITLTDCGIKVKIVNMDEVGRG